MNRIPEHMQESIELWVNYGLPHPREMGSFLRAVLLHDLMGAATHADDKNRAALADWASYLHNEVPAIAHGTGERLLTWHARGGLRGKAA